MLSPGISQSPQFRKPRFLIGTMDWAYREWEGVFYPKRISRKDHLSYYAEHFPTVEVNSTFYGELKERTALAWCKSTPDGFVFSVKAPAFITHHEKLRVSDESNRVLSSFLEGLSPIRGKLGPILFQLPSTLECVNLQAFEKFLALMPEERRFAFEFRHPSWFREDVLKAMERHKACLALSSSPSGSFPAALTSDFMHLRIRGDMEWAKRSEYEERIAEFPFWVRDFLKAHPIDMYIYWDNNPISLALYSALLALKLL